MKSWTIHPTCHLCFVFEKENINEKGSFKDNPKIKAAETKQVAFISNE